jgi:hypothetical protein
MYKRLDRADRSIPLVLGLVTLISVGVLLTWDVNPQVFPANAGMTFLARSPCDDRDCLPLLSKRAPTSA